MQGGEHKKWQNLLYKKCPVCDGRLKAIKEKALMFICQGEGCSFIISAQRYAEILADEDHIMRRFLTARERILLATALGTAFDPGGSNNLTALDKVS